MAKDCSNLEVFFYQIALSCIHMACIVLGKDARNWFAELHVDLDKIQDICKHILGLYELWKGFDERKEMSSILQKMPRPKTQPSPPQQQPQQQHQQMQQHN